MSTSATPDTIFNHTLSEAFEALKAGANDLVTVRRIQKRADELTSMDVAGAWELRAYASAINDGFDAADEMFACALRLQPGNLNVRVRWLAMLCVTGQVGKVKEKFVAFRPTLDGNFAAMSAVISLLGYVGLLHDAFRLRERVAALGGNPGVHVFDGEFGLGSAAEAVPANALSTDDFPEPLPCSVYTFSAEEAEEVLAEQGLGIDAWSEPIGCAIRFLRQKRLKVVAVKSSFIPHDDRATAMHFQLLIVATPDICWEAEWEFCGVLVDRDFPIINSGTATIAFIPTLREAPCANHS
jgi:hypothetical protein